jgi:hypothetical protein
VDAFSTIAAAQLGGVLAQMLAAMDVMRVSPRHRRGEKPPGHWVRAGRLETAPGLEHWLLREGGHRRLHFESVRDGRSELRGDQDPGFAASVRDWRAFARYWMGRASEGGPAGGEFDAQRSSGAFLHLPNDFLARKRQGSSEGAQKQTSSGRETTKGTSSGGRSVVAGTGVEWHIG